MFCWIELASFSMCEITKCICVFHGIRHIKKASHSPRMRGMRKNEKE